MPYHARAPQQREQQSRFRHCADGGSLQGSDPTPAADSLPGARAGADASGRAHHPSMAETEATNPAYPELTAAVVDGDAPAAGGSPE